MALGLRTTKPRVAKILNLIKVRSVNKRCRFDRFLTNMHSRLVELWLIHQFGAVHQKELWSLA